MNHKIMLLVLGALAVLSGAAFYAAPNAGRKLPVGQLRVSAIGKEIELISELGEPLETLVTLRGEMFAADRFEKQARMKVPPRADEYMRVRRVGDRELSEPVELYLGSNWHRGKAPAPGAPIEVIGYSRLYYRGDSPVAKAWETDRRNRHETPKEPEPAGVVYPGHYNDEFRVLQFDDLSERPKNQP